MVVEQLTRPGCSTSAKLNPYSKCFGAPDKHPKVGDKFQVELPPLSAELNLVKAAYREDSRHDVFITRSIPVTWISHGHDIPSQEARDFLAPGVCSEPWSDAEKASFLLGLYIFLKNLVEVRRFVESKDMNAVLSYYYGEFHGSPEHRRWSDCRKKKTRRCVIGKKIFCGPREQELLSRVLPSVSEDCKDALLEVSKGYGDQKVSLSDYVSSLKVMVGMDKLVEAVGIGNGTRDLTGRAFECSRSNQSIPMHPQIPPKKAFSSLTTSSEIITILSGGCRLSKARSNELFWEAVWPRLLARGWNSVEPSGLKKSLVFLAPGVKTFSRRKLEKGVQYFDSVVDVLGTVAKEPGLIELDGEDNGKNKKEESTDQKSAQERDNDGDDNDDGDGDLSSGQRHCYLQPKKRERSSNTVQVTVVDTSSSRGRIRELRELPVESLNSSTLKNHLENSYKNASEEITDKPETTKSCPEISDKSVSKLKRKEEFHEKKQSKKVAKSLSIEKVKRGSAGSKTPITRRDARLTTGNREENDTGTSRSLPTSRLENGMSSCSSSLQETPESLPSQTETPESLPSETGSYQNTLSPSTSSVKDSPSENAQGAPSSNIPALESYHRAEPRLWLDLNEPPVSPEPENQTTEQDAEPRLWLDLNEPPVSPEPENQTTEQDAEPRLWLDLNEPPVSPEPENQTTEQDDHHLPNNSLSNGAGSEQQDTDHSLPSSSTSDARPRLEPEPIVNPRRHSMRSRPPTTRALEALANGYLTVNRRRKSKDGGSHDERASRSSRRARVAVESTHSTVASQTEEAKNDASNSGESKLACNSEAKTRSSK